MSIVRTGLGTVESARRIRFESTSTIAATNTQKAIEEVAAEAQPLDPTLTALAALDSTAGMLAQTGADAFAKRTLGQPAAGLAIGNPDGAAGNPTFALANDLAAVEGLSGVGFAVRTAVDTWAQRQLAQPAAGITISNPFGLAGDPTFALANDLAALEALSGTNTIYYRSGSDAWSAVTVGTSLSFSGGTLNLAAATPPQGRLTLTSGTAVMISDVASGTTVYYTPAAGRYVPLWNSTTSLYVMTDTGGELSQATTDASKSPAAVANNSNYDCFVWSDSGTMRCTRGPAWSSDTARGTGAGTTELEFLQGFYVNKVAITNGPAARAGMYVGTVRSNGSAAIDMKFGTAAAGGGESRLCVWNTYNQVRTRGRAVESTTTWTYSGTLRQTNNSATNRVSFVSGLQQHHVRSMVGGNITTGAVAGMQVRCGMALDSTAATDASATYSNGSANGVQIPLAAHNDYLPQLGFHFVQGLEASDGTNNATFNGFSLFSFVLVDMLM